MKKRYIIMAFFMIAGLFNCPSVYVKKVEAKGKTYTISPNKIPKSVKKSSAYNKNTKNSLQMQYYLKKLQKGGGRLVLKKGTYKICSTLFVPSNTTIELKEGAVLKKINKGKSNYKPTKNMFLLCSYKNRNKTNVYKKYNGPQNIKFIGHGSKSIIDLSYIKGAHGVSGSHNQNVTFQNITFKGQNGGHYIEIAGVKNVTIKDNRFLSAKSSTRSSAYNKEAINIDTPDKATGGFTLRWSRKDQTPNVNVMINNNVFDGVNRAIGTHKYSQKKDKKGKYSKSSVNVYHQRIQIRNNQFKNIYDNAVFMMNWENTTIDSNQFSKIGLKNKRNTNTAKHGVAGGGIRKLTLTNNRFIQERSSVVYLRRTANNGSGSKYYPLLVYVTGAELQKMGSNSALNCSRDPVYPSYDILMFKGDGNRSRDNAYGMDLKSGKIIAGIK